MFFGAQYYRPPFPNRDCWKRDMANMKKLGFNTIKLWAVWNDIERTEGEFLFEDLDKLVELAEKNNLTVIMNTIPEGAPYWLYRKYPDCHYETVKGEKITMGGPANLPTGGWPGLCMDNPEVSDMVCRFVYEVAKHYRNHKNIPIIDVWNEPHLEPMFDYKNELLCACQASRKVFRFWLKERYGTLESLNNAWFRRYTDWEDIVPPPRFGTYTDMMDWRKFWLFNLAEWLKKRVEAARKGAPEKIIQTHTASADYMGALSDGALGIELSDEFLLAKEVDLFGLSSFPKWLMGKSKKEYDLAHMLQSEIICAASREKKFYQAELQGGAGVPGFLGHKVPTREDIRVWNWNTIAAGGKGVVYWQYAPEPSGMESPGFGLTGADGENTERSLEAGRCAVLLNDIRLDNSMPILSCNGIYLSRNADLFLFAAGSQEEKYTHSIAGVYESCVEVGIPVRFVHSDFMKTAWEEGLRHLYVPMALALSKEEEQDLLNFAAAGGKLIVEAAAGLYNEVGALKQDGLLNTAFGVRKWEIDAKDDIQVIFDKDGKKLCEGSGYRQTMKMEQGMVMGWFEDGTPAMAETAYGKGKIYWTGTFIALAAKDEQSSSAKAYICEKFDVRGYDEIKKLEAVGLIVRLLKSEEKILLAAVNHSADAKELYVMGKSGIEIEAEIPGCDGILLEMNRKE